MLIRKEQESDNELPESPKVLIVVLIHFIVYSSSHGNFRALSSVFMENQLHSKRSEPHKNGIFVELLISMLAFHQLLRGLVEFSMKGLLDQLGICVPTLGRRGWLILITSLFETHVNRSLLLKRPRHRPAHLSRYGSLMSQIPTGTHSRSLRPMEMLRYDIGISSSIYFHNEVFYV